MWPLASVSSAGDINGDGFDDLIVGSPEAYSYGYGSSCVVFGRASGFNAALDLSSLDGTNGFRLNGVAVYNNSGSSVSSAGDINGDGFDDVIIGGKLFRESLNKSADSRIENCHRIFTYRHETT